MKQKGFTLIELLAVIVILAIIALIAVPIVLRVVENARKSAAVSSSYVADDSKKVWILNWSGGFINSDMFTTDGFGIRPVIEISKSMLNS